jgi:pyridoxamine 5'-phosphate oxidase
MININDLRKEYSLKSLDLKDLNLDPFEQFKRWFLEATECQILEPNAMVLATASLAGQPSSRMMLLKEVSDIGFIFYTNYESRKGRDLEENPFASLTFFWKELERQVHVEGKVEKLTVEASRRYFNSRPRGSQLATFSSKQGEMIESKEILKERYRQIKEEYEGRDIPLPSYWGGYCLIPYRFEFWQGRPNRLHDRFQYRIEGKQWSIARLMP